MSSVFITLSGRTTIPVNQQVNIRLTSINTGSATGIAVNIANSVI